MKKSLVLASLLAAFGAASAQSSVTMYGWVDLSLTQAKTTTGAAGLPAGYSYGAGNFSGVSQTRLDSGNVNGSRWGIRGSEALGGGLNAIFTIETGIAADTANNNTGTFSTGGRQVFAGLSSANMGTFTAGRQYSSYDDTRSGMSPMGHTSFDANLNVWSANGINYTGRAANSLKYKSANYSGFTFGAAYALGEDKTVAASASNITAINLGYAVGPIAVAFATQKEKVGVAGTQAVTASGPTGAFGAITGGLLNNLVPAGGTNKSNTMLIGSYNFGVAKLTLGMNNGKSNAAGFNTEKETVIGVNVPLGAVTVDAAYAMSKQKASYKANGFGVQAIYALSPRTSAYVGLMNMKADTNPAAGASANIAKYSITSVGLRHNF